MERSPSLACCPGMLQSAPPLSSALNTTCWKYLSQWKTETKASVISMADTENFFTQGPQLHAIKAVYPRRNLYPSLHPQSHVTHSFKKCEWPQSPLPFEINKTFPHPSYTIALSHINTVSQELLSNWNSYKGRKRWFVSEEHALLCTEA